MRSHNDDLLKEILQKVPTDSLPADFTANLLDEIASIAQRDIPITHELQQLLHKTPIETLPPDFTTAVLEKISVLNTPKIYQPIIGKRAWYGIALATVLTILVLIAVGGKPQHNHSAKMYTTVITDVMQQLYSGPVYSIIIILGILLFIDYTIRYTRSETIKGNSFFS
ncbi:hypothetical protein [Flavobacterium kingsejongi]|uniref:Uncharacterized protein n=1 Tax=Flavobacterium kingsejongi TaxID=1678728 RepID=A0A2S1LPY8_9FLAO|nr:hypothetical protein [Flavobacterium kingsejongi]AWG25789.1 hypothetical protein FK004_11425 [Flavobacterium kingsejongi]